MAENIKMILLSLALVVCASSTALPADSATPLTASGSCAWPQKPQSPSVPGCKHKLLGETEGCTAAQCGARIKQEMAQVKTFYNAQLAIYQTLLKTLQGADGVSCSIILNNYLTTRTNAYAFFKDRQTKDETAYDNSCVITNDPLLPTK